MGRGRQKAKATKQARDMKYYSPSTDYSALERELSTRNRAASRGYQDDLDESDEYEDTYADQADDDEQVHDRRIG